MFTVGSNRHCQPSSTITVTTAIITLGSKHKWYFCTVSNIAPIHSPARGVVDENWSTAFAMSARKSV